MQKNKSKTKIKIKNVHTRTMTMAMMKKKRKKIAEKNHVEILSKNKKKKKNKNKTKTKMQIDLLDTVADQMRKIVAATTTTTTKTKEEENCQRDDIVLDVLHKVLNDEKWSRHDVSSHSVLLRSTLNHIFELSQQGIDEWDIFICLDGSSLGQHIVRNLRSLKNDGFDIEFHTATTNMTDQEEEEEEEGRKMALISWKPK